MNAGTHGRLQERSAKLVTARFGVRPAADAIDGSRTAFKLWLSPRSACGGPGLAACPARVTPRCFAKQLAA